MRSLENYVHSSSPCSIWRRHAPRRSTVALCLDMHTKDARAMGETEQRLYMLSAWREPTFYTPRKRAALTWAEVALIADEGVSDELYKEADDTFQRMILST